MAYSGLWTPQPRGLKATVRSNSLKPFYYTRLVQCSVVESSISICARGFRGCVDLLGDFHSDPIVLMQIKVLSIKLDLKSIDLQD